MPMSTFMKGPPGSGSLHYVVLHSKVRKSTKYRNTASEVIRVTGMFRQRASKSDALQGAHLQGLLLLEASVRLDEIAPLVNKGGGSAPVTVLQCTTIHHVLPPGSPMGHMSVDEAWESLCVNAYLQVCTQWYDNHNSVDTWRGRVTRIKSKTSQLMTCHMAFCAKSEQSSTKTRMKGTGPLEVLIAKGMYVLCGAQHIDLGNMKNRWAFCAVPKTQ